jgi:hypothetical protein
MLIEAKKRRPVEILDTQGREEQGLATAAAPSHQNNGPNILEAPDEAPSGDRTPLVPRPVTAPVGAAVQPIKLSRDLTQQSVDAPGAALQPIKLLSSGDTENLTSQNVPLSVGAPPLIPWPVAAPVGGTPLIPRPVTAPVGETPLIPRPVATPGAALQPIKLSSSEDTENLTSQNAPLSVGAPPLIPWPVPPSVGTAVDNTLEEEGHPQEMDTRSDSDIDSEPTPKSPKPVIDLTADDEGPSGDCVWLSSTSPRVEAFTMTGSQPVTSPAPMEETETETSANGALDEPPSPEEWVQHNQLTPTLPAFSLQATESHTFLGINSPGPGSAYGETSQPFSPTLTFLASENTNDFLASIASMTSSLGEWGQPEIPTTPPRPPIAAGRVGHTPHTTIPGLTPLTLGGERQAAIPTIPPLSPMEETETETSTNGALDEPPSPEEWGQHNQLTPTLPASSSKPTFAPYFEAWYQTSPCALRGSWPTETDINMEDVQLCPLDDEQDMRRNPLGF